MMASNAFRPTPQADGLSARVDAACTHLAARPVPDALFSVADLASVLAVPKRDAYAVIQRMVKLGRAEITGPRIRSKPGSWRFMSNVRVATPRKPATATDQLWAAMRAMPKFSPSALANHANVGTVEVTIDAARTYCRALLQAGYLRVIQRAGADNEAVYRLLKRSGPTAPILRRIQAIVDRNTDETIVLKGGAV